MKIFFPLIIFLAIAFHSFSQKPVIDSSSYGKWASIGGTAISNNGHYVLYTVEDKIVGKNKLVILATHANWEIEIPDAVNASFTSDSRKFIFTKGKDSLGIGMMGVSVVEYIPNVHSFKVSNKGPVSWLAYQLDRPSNELIVRNMVTDRQKSFKGVANYLFNGECKVLLLMSEVKKDSNTIEVLQWIDLSNSRVTPIWEGPKAGNFTFDVSGTQLVFCVNEKDENDQHYAIYYYKEGMYKAFVLANNSSKGIEMPFFITNNRLTFSNNGNKIFFTLQKNLPVSLSKKPGLSGVDIWNYKDKYLQSEQLSTSFIDNDLKTKFIAVINIGDKKIIRLEDENVSFYEGESNNNFVLGVKRESPDFYYDKKSYRLWYLISENDGSRKTPIQRSSLPTHIRLSPKERFVVWFDFDSLSYFSYEIATAITRNISQSIPYPVYDEEALNIARYRDFGTAGWLKGNDDAILIYDRYDIWQIDTKGLKAPVNITNGYGRRQKIVFGVVNTDPTNQNEIISSKETLLLTGYNRINKYNGFWKAKMDSRTNPQNCIMAPYAYYIPMEHSYEPRVGITGNVECASAGEPIKARNVNRWLVKRMSAKESPNLFVTTDFKSFKQISNIQPEKGYNWMTNELVNWKMADGRISQGVLYKPENFDSTKKYPLLFTYYEKRSDELNKYLVPDWSKDRINIASYVSNGYLVFVPDIYYAPGHNGQGVVNAVVSAAKYLSTLCWVDSTRLGLQGHSFAGWETNFLITHSNLFAAACEAAGASNHISAYGQLNFGTGTARQKFYETDSQGSPYGIGVTPWTKPELYIENSPIFNIDKVTTPLLMMHGDLDQAVPIEQAIEMFLGMKRAGKRVWLLKYKNADHNLFDENSKDYTIRMQQFFDHYLKGAPAPKWMTRGIPAKLNGIDDGLELDYEIKTPGPGLLKK